MFNYIKKRFGHWTPRYIYNRIGLFINEKLHPDWPWLTKDAVLLLNQLLKNEDIGLEFGSGRSTIWFAKRIKKLISIEHDNNWFEFVKTKLKKENINNVDYYLKSETDYLNILNNIDNNSIDFVLVDGLRRDEVSKLVLPKIKNGGILIIDNINWFIPSNSYSPSSKRNNNFESEIWREVWLAIKNFRKVWTTNGVTDTLIVLKYEE
ncbi:MAG: class I SAM-dependent methyltransferase [Candidatus Goldbacteria bacterium]|nr:class I SAM-dependent methyltransferase [Candidatus Goldiibacteriota bacterium]